MNKNKRGIVVILVILLVLIIDQASKIWVKTSMGLFESIKIVDWFEIYFVENKGMAFGMEMGGKLFLSLFRIIATGFIGYYLYTLVKKKFPVGYLICFALIWAGAFGNIIDGIFYGELFSASYQGHIASFVPLGEGYAPWLHGKVVDMFYFPFFKGTFPTWIPVWGGDDFTFFSYVFNIADSAITIGIFLLIICYRKTLSRSLEKQEKI